MPIISRFLGITIAMFYRDHDPPHFHVAYAEWSAIVFIKNGEIRGFLPRRVESLVIEWWTQHREALYSNWERAQNGEPLTPIPALDES